MLGFDLLILPQKRRKLATGTASFTAGLFGVSRRHSRGMVKARGRVIQTENEGPAEVGETRQVGRMGAEGTDRTDMTDRTDEKEDICR